MVIKGSARGGAGSLATHLLRTDHNERAELRELRGVVARDLKGALREMAATVAAAGSRRPFYHASINTLAAELMDDEQKGRAIDRLEAELGLTGQPRIVEEHRKHGREHLHVVWLRINQDTLTAVPDSHNYRRHEIVARELEREFGHQRVQGAHIERDGVERPTRTPTTAEIMQAERSGLGPENAKARLRELWEAADNGRSFAAALDDAGWSLARGDKRGFVALDPAGEVRSVNKDITGMTAAKVRDRLADIDLDQLPSVDEARAQQRERQHERRQAANLVQPVPVPEPAPVAVLTLPVAAPEVQPDKPLTLDLEQVHAPQCEDVAKEPETPARVVAAEIEQTTQRPSYEVEKSADPRRLTEIVTSRPTWLQKAWDHVAALGDRLEVAFSRIVGRDRQADQVPTPATLPAAEPIRPATPAKPQEPEDAMEIAARRLAERAKQEPQRDPAEDKSRSPYGGGRDDFLPDYGRGRELRKPGF